jgi:hypothetical protein
LFGGETSGGGFQGRFRCHTGSNSQPVNQYLASKNAQQSAWPGFTYVVVTDISETEGATIGESNNLRDLRVEFQMFSTIANGGLGNELSLTGDKHIIGRDANPISCAFRVLQDVDWSIATSDINFTNFQAAAEICFTEGIGYSQQVDSEIQAYEIIAEIEKHIDGYIGPNPTNGLLEITLARADYVIADEFQANETNIREIKNWAKAEWPQTKNEVKVRFVNREKDYKDDHSVAQDMAGRLIAGRPISVTIRFPGLRDKTAANAIVARTSRAYFWPLSKFELLMDRTAYAIRPGDVIVVTHPQIAATDLPCRVTRTRTGDPVQQTIRLDVVEDIFQFETGTQAPPQDTEHVPPSDQPVAITNFVDVKPPRWLYDREDQIFEPRLLYLVARDTPNNQYLIRYRTRDTAFAGNLTGNQLDQLINTHVRHGTMRAIAPITESPALALDLFRGVSNNNGTASVADGGGFFVDGSLAAIAGTYNPQAFVPGSSGLAVIDAKGPNEEWIAITTITVVDGGILCEGVIRFLGDSGNRQHYEGEDFWFVDTGMYMQENKRPDQTDESYGFLYGIQPFAPGGEGVFSSEVAEQNLNGVRYKYPYPPTAVVIDQLSTTRWYSAGDVDASIPTNLSTPSVAGLNFEVWNRHFDQLNPVYGANSLNDQNRTTGSNEFSEFNPTLKWWLYDLDATPNPIHVTDSIAAGTSPGFDDRINQQFFNETIFQGISGIESGFNCRYEFVWENQASPGKDGVYAGIESRTVWTDHITFFSPDPESPELIEDTLLLLHFDGLDGTTQVLDYSPNNHLVTLSGGVQIDDGKNQSPEFAAPAFRSPNDNVSHMVHPFSATASPQVSCEVTDNSPSVFSQMTSKPGFIIQARVRFTVAPTGEIPIVTKWREGDNERQFWFGLFGTDLRLKLSNNGTNEIIEDTGPRTWNLNQWYEICVTVWDRHPTTGTSTYVYFFVDGVFDERETFADDQLFHDSAAPVRIGSDGDGNTVPETTYIDEVRIVALPVYKIPYTQQTAQFPGREYSIPFLWGGVDFDGSPEPALGSPYPADRSGFTEDLNRWTLDFGTHIAGSPEEFTTFIDPSQSKFGGASLFCGGVDVGTSGTNCDGVVLTDSANAPQHEFDKRPFTIEGFVRFAALPSATDATNGMRMLDKFWRGTTPAWGNWGFNFSGSDVLQWHDYNSSNQSKFLTAVQSPLPVVDTWYHVAVVRDGDGLALFFEGDRVAYDDEYFLNREGLRSDGNIPLCFGRRYIVSGATRLAPFHGWLDEFRILNGIAEYDITQTTLTIPTAPFPRDPLPEV